MKKLILFAALMSAVVSIYAQDEVPRSGGIHWNNDIGISLGYSYIHSPLKGDNFVSMAPQNLLTGDIWILGVYLGVSGWSNSTGYDVYGYKELINSFLFKIGPLFRTEFRSIKVVFGPYIGGIFDSVKDQSGNNIGARTEYGDHANGFVAGARVGILVKNFVFSIHGSNREAGLTIGYAFQPNWL